MDSEKYNEIKEELWLQLMNSALRGTRLELASRNIVSFLAEIADGMLREYEKRFVK
jgi:hypothetical protein